MANYLLSGIAAEKVSPENAYRLHKEDVSLIGEYLHYSWIKLLRCGEVHIFEFAKK